MKLGRDSTGGRYVSWAHYLLSDSRGSVIEIRLTETTMDLELWFRVLLIIHNENVLLNVLKVFNLINVNGYINSTQ